LAENEKGTPSGERNVIEMSIWFFVLLVVVIIGVARIMQLKNIIKEKETIILNLQSSYEHVSDTNNTALDTIRKLNAISDEYLKAYEEATTKASEEVSTSTPTPVSGEVSGEVVVAE